MENIYNAIQNVYNMDKTTWQEVLAEMYNLVSNVENKFDLFENKFGLLLGKEVTLELKKMYDDGLLGSLINDVLLKDINTKVDAFKTEVSEQLDTKGIKTFVTPEEFFIDGENDDTQMLQRAINYAQENNVSISATTNKIYNISSPLEITKKVIIDLNNATIKAINTIESIIEYNSSERLTNIKNVMLDCNNHAKYGINCVNGRTCYISNVHILNGVDIGIFVQQGYEFFFNNIYMKGNGKSNTVGIKSCGDNHFSNIIIVDFHISIHSTNPSFYNNVHGWLTSNAQIEHSRFIYGSGGGSFNQCYCDSYHYGYYPTSDTNYGRFTDFYIFCNPTIYTSDIVSDVPTLFHFDNAEQSKMVSITNSTFRPIDTTSGFSKGGKFSNLSISNWKGEMSNCRFDGIDGKPDFIESSLVLSDGWTSKYNRLTKKNGIVKLELNCYYSTNIPINKSIPLVGGDGLSGGFPAGFEPKNSKKVIAMIGHQWDYENICYCYITGSSEFSSIEISTTKEGNNYISLDIEYESI